MLSTRFPDEMSFHGNLMDLDDDARSSIVDWMADGPAVESLRRWKMACMLAATCKFWRNVVVASSGMRGKFGWPSARVLFIGVRVGEDSEEEDEHFSNCTLYCSRRPNSLKPDLRLVAHVGAPLLSDPSQMVQICWESYPVLEDFVSHCAYPPGWRKAYPEDEHPPFRMAFMDPPAPAQPLRMRSWEFVHVFISHVVQERCGPVLQGGQVHDIPWEDYGIYHPGGCIPQHIQYSVESKTEPHQYGRTTKYHYSDEVELQLRGASPYSDAGEQMLRPEWDVFWGLTVENYDPNMGLEDVSMQYCFEIDLRIWAGYEPGVDDIRQQLESVQVKAPKAPKRAMSPLVFSTELTEEDIAKRKAQKAAATAATAANLAILSKSEREFNDRCAGPSNEYDSDDSDVEIDASDASSSDEEEPLASGAPRQVHHFDPHGPPPKRVPGKRAGFKQIMREFLWRKANGIDSSDEEGEDCADSDDEPPVDEGAESE